jgi:hypothetical protein
MSDEQRAMSGKIERCAGRIEWRDDEYSGPETVDKRSELIVSRTSGTSHT